MAENETKWAVIELGGKQHLVSSGAKIQVNQVEKAPAETITLSSLLDQTPVTLKVLEHFRGEKIHGLKFKNKVRYLKHYGHRQNLSSLEVVSIGKSEPKAVVKEMVVKEKTAPKAVKKVAAKKPVAKKTVEKAK